MKNTIIIICIFILIILGVYFGLQIYNNREKVDNTFENNDSIEIKQNQLIKSVEVSSEEEKTTPKTLVLYKTYYTKCKHYSTRYDNIDVSNANLTQKEFKERCKGWNIEKFSSKEIELSRQEESFCNEHYKIKLENGVIVIYKVDENGIETEYELTGITTEYLTEQDILKLNTGIIIYGKENLTSTIEDYE